MATSLPKWIEKPHHRELWRRPWTVPSDPRKAADFKRLLLKHNHLSPHFTLAEAACHDAARTPVPRGLLDQAQGHAFNLERLRHELGDVSLPILSWYRTDAHNDAVEGASESRHLKADGTDFTVATVQRIGTAKFDRAAEKVFANGGFGRYPSGSRHVDSRGSRARW
ncbi:MAG TPA: D-Ala-D-Ala carboxypeptidase family metallohydrolase [Solirubrobacterales bacterium]